MVELATTYPDVDETTRRALNQAARELLLHKVVTGYLL